MPRASKQSKKSSEPILTLGSLSEQEADLYCNACDIHFKRKRDCVRHKYRHEEPEASKKWRCDWPGCDHSTREKSNLMVHEKTHTGKKDKICTWIEEGVPCCFRCLDPSSFNRHCKKHVSRALANNIPIQEDFQHIVQRVKFPQKRARRVPSEASQAKKGQQSYHGGEITMIPELGFSSPSCSSTSSEEQPTLGPFLGSSFAFGIDPPAYLSHDTPGTLAHDVHDYGYGNSPADVSIASPFQADKHQQGMVAGWPQGDTSLDPSSFDNLLDWSPSVHIQLQTWQSDLCSYRPPSPSTFWDVYSLPMTNNTPMLQHTMSSTSQALQVDESENISMYGLGYDWKRFSSTDAQ